MLDQLVKLVEQNAGDAIVKNEIIGGATFQLVAFCNGIMAIVETKDQRVNVIDVDVVLVPRIKYAAVMDKFTILHRGFAIGDITTEDAHFIAVKSAVRHP